MSLFIVAREVWTPALPARPGGAGGPLRSSAHAEAALGRGEGGWIVLWKTPAMSSTAFDDYDALTDAWPRYTEHRAAVRLLRNPPKHNERTRIERQISALQEQLAAL
ncbi:hypothetical protein GCM10022631_10540 [Deinococcus rubellus]|uniref:hypothetical protein n=1 Tax=Deinococcus rubellus TaxID=1889240 RepID=UPI0031E7F832